MDKFFEILEDLNLNQESSSPPQHTIKYLFFILDLQIYSFDPR